MNFSYTTLESVLCENTRRVYGAQWRIFTDWCADVGLRYLAARAGGGASIATLRLATSAISVAHRVGGPRIALPGPGRASLKGDDRRELP